MKRFLFPLIACLTLVLFGCETKQEVGSDAQGHTAPTKFTTEKNKEIAKSLPLDNQTDFEQARKGLIASDPKLIVTGKDGKTIWDSTAYNFMKGEAPASVNPSLWRQAQLNNIHGLFKVTEGVYQVRGFDLANFPAILDRFRENAWRNHALVFSQVLGELADRVLRDRAACLFVVP